MNLPLKNDEFLSAEGGEMVILRTRDGYELQIESGFEVRDSTTQTHRIIPGTEMIADELELLVGVPIVDAWVDSDHILRIVLENGTAAIAPPDPDYEAWTLVGPADFRVVSEPGGELAVWGSSQ
ncbi:DUF6188 family protein [Nocardia amikacinitolerans]|uniref:DUF6188 family protein n=1 Tax=Nocardia amikacinitolerans TaxID=756689 RepID=UPI0020A44B2B|nr:DUF6188 family protein [Nocardia amikacinitolerans]MCP2289125.1 hypothetical protein [Nocardia amikacinitolerans]